MNNHLLIKEFSNSLRPLVEILILEINKPQLETKECLEKIKEIRGNITHLNNLLKIEQVLETRK